jgi:hypothetical protein
MLRRSFLPALLLVACTSLYADVTMRMSWEMKINMAIPGAVPQLPFKEFLTRIKGDRSYAAIGPIIAVTDLSTGKVTLMDPKTQRYAAIALADYVSKLSGASGQNMQNVPEEAKQMIAKTKFDIQSRDTGRTDRILGIDAFEREVVVNVSIPVPIPGQENGMQISLKLQVWKPKPAELERVPALRELVAYNERNKGLNDPGTMLRQLFGAMPGMGDNAGKVADEITKGGNVTLGMHMGVSMPGLAKMMEQARASGAAVPDLPAGDKPLAEMNLDLKELSSDKVADEVFAIPAGFKEAPVEDVLKGMLAAFTGAKP